MWNLNQSGSPVTVDGALLLVGPTLLQPYWPHSYRLLLSVADTARDQDITKLIPNHHRFEGAHSQTQISYRANRMSPQPFPDWFYDAYSTGPPILGSLAIEGMMCWERKEEIFPQILFLIFSHLVRFSKSVTLTVPWIPQPDSLNLPSFCDFAFRWEQWFLLTHLALNVCISTVVYQVALHFLGNNRLHLSHLSGKIKAWHNKKLLHIIFMFKVIASIGTFQSLSVVPLATTFT